MKKFAVFASGNGSNLQALIDAVSSGKIQAELGLVFSDRSNAFALERARRAGVETFHLDPKNYSDRQTFEKDILKKCQSAQIDFIVLAGYMRLMTSQMIDAYPNKILNIHPSLLPQFKGAHAIRDAFESRVKSTGVTVHVVDEQMDHGPIILQETVVIDPHDTLESLEKKIHAVEHKIYPHAVALMAEEKLKIFDGKVVFISPT